MTDAKRMPVLGSEANVNLHDSLGLKHGVLNASVGDIIRVVIAERRSTDEAQTERHPHSDRVFYYTASCDRSDREA